MKKNKSKTFICEKTAIVDHEYIYEGQEYKVDKSGHVIMDDGFILYPRYGELERYGHFVD